MKKKLILHVSAIFAAVTFMSSCGSGKYVVYTPGENLTALTKVHESEYVCANPYGGDNGKNLFFVVRDKNLSSNIYRKDNPTSLAVSQVTGGTNYYVNPAYCAAINKVAFAGRSQGSSVNDLFMVNADKGGALIQVTNTPDANEFHPCFNRDGSKVVYEKWSSRYVIQESEVWVKNLKNNEFTLLGLGRFPTFSPDGNTIAFVRYVSDLSATQLCVVNSDGTNVRYLTDVNFGTVSNPSFSPDGKQIVFQCNRKSKKDNDLYVVDMNGSGNLTQLTINKSYDGEPYWANDGNIYFTSDRGGKDGHYQIWRFNYGGATQRQQYSSASDYTPQRTSVSSSAMDNSYSSAQATYHTVAEGETITNIARRYGITVKDVVKWNNLTTMTISKGMRLRVSAQ